MVSTKALVKRQARCDSCNKVWLFVDGMANLEKTMAIRRKGEIVVNFLFEGKSWLHDAATSIASLLDLLVRFD